MKNNQFDNRDLVAFQEEPNINQTWRFQTTSSKIKRQMMGRNSFSLTAYAINAKFWIFRVGLPSKQAVKSRFKSLTGREAKWSEEKELFY